MDAGKENARNLCPALDPGLWVALRKFHELLLFIALDTHKCFRSFCVITPVVELVSQHLLGSGLETLVWRILWTKSYFFHNPHHVFGPWLIELSALSVQFPVLFSRESEV